MAGIKTIKIFLASPMEVVDERRQFRELIKQINEEHAIKQGFAFDVVCWEENVLPGVGIDAQDVVNQQIDMNYDVFVALFKSKVGTPTHRYLSGTIEEYERARMLKDIKPELKIMCYFLGDTDSNAIRDLKTKFNSEGILWNELKTNDEYKDKIFKHFIAILNDYASGRIKKENDSVPQANTCNHSVAVAIVHETRMLIVKRSKKLKVFGGYWQIPGGKVKKDEEYAQTAIREIKEELSLDLDEASLKHLSDFYSADVSNKEKTIAIHLFICEVASEDLEVVLNTENEAWKWIDFSNNEFNEVSFFGSNKLMANAIWREIMIAGKLEKILLNYDEYSGTFPTEISGISTAELNSLYCYLNILGVVSLSNKEIRCASEYSRQLIQALIHLSRSGKSIFNNSQIDLISTLNIQKDEYMALNNQKTRLLYSHKSLLSMLSCMTELDNCIRNVCDVCIFGKYKDEDYILMRWDFYANKYQLVSSGLSKDCKTGEFVNNAEYVVTRRFGKLMNTYLECFGLGQVTTKHLSAGSVVNDPILRTYNVDVVSAHPKKDSKEINELIKSINEKSIALIHYSDSISRSNAKNILLFRWCKVDTLFNSRISYGGRSVRGIDELLTNIGENTIRRHMKNVIQIDSVMPEDEFSNILSDFDSKICNG